MKIKKVIFLVSLTIVALAVFYAYREYNRAPIDTASSSPDFSVKGTALIADFEQDEAGAAARYVNKLIRVEDTLLDFTVDEAVPNGQQASYTLVLGSAQGNTTLRCSMDSLFSIKATPVAKGQRVVLQGICSGYNKDELLGSDIVLVRCALIKK